MDKRNLIRAKWFILGILTALMLSGTVLMAASPAMREIVFGVRVSLDGDIIQFEDDMQPFIMDGRTFLPARAIAEIAGLDVGYDAATNTVTLTTAAHQLLGTWVWDGLDTWRYTFYADGTGIRGDPAYLLEFSWRAHGDHLVIDTDIMQESWTFVIDGDGLTLTSRQVADMEFSYIRVATPGAENNDNAQPQQAGIPPMRGAWSGNIYTNHYLGLRFRLPAGWVAHTDAEIADVMDFAVGYVIDQGLDVSEESNIFAEMMASNPATGANVQILFERLHVSATITIDEFIQNMIEGMELIGGSVYLDFPGTTRIGAYDWYSYGTMLDFGTITTHGRQFIVIQGGYIKHIVITYAPTTETPEDILQMFRSI